MSEKVRVMVTAVGGGGHGEQILKALRLAGPDKYYIVGADATVEQPQFEMVDAVEILPLASDPAYLDTLIAACRRHRVQVLFHGCEPELKLFARERARLEAEGLLLPVNPTDLIETCMNKERTNAVLGDLGFNVPRFARATSMEALAAIDWFPVVVKPFIGAGGSANCFIAQSTIELQALAAYIGLEGFGQGFLVQEYVGTPEEEFTVGVLHDMDGTYINSIALRRHLTGQLNIRVRVPNRTGRDDLGSHLVISSGVSHGTIGRFPDVTAQCEQIAAALGARGPVNIQCRFVDGEVRVFEINPRFSGTTSLRALVGYNEPDILIRRHILSETIEPRFAYDEAVILRQLAERRLKGEACLS